jgi:hypothetical protein
MRVIIATATAAGLFFASPAIAQIPTGAAYQQLCAKHGTPPEQCQRGPGILDGNFDMKRCLDTPSAPTQRLSQQARCNLVADCFKKKDPSAHGGECARGWAAGIPFDYDPQHPPLANPPTRDQLFEQLNEQYKRMARGQAK